MFVNCCHCTWCQRETGSAFVINAVIESDRVTLTKGAIEMIDTPSESGKGQKIARCPACRVALWSHYSGSGTRVSFVRVGTLDDPAQCPPDAFIFTRSKQPWVALPDHIPAFPIFYNIEKQWSAESLARRQAVRASME